MAWTQGEIDELKRAIATGALKVRYSNSGGTREVEYRDLAEMKKILKDMEDEVNQDSGLPRASSFIRPGYSKGLS